MPFEGYAILELLGHRQRPGFVTEVEVAGSKMLRVDVPMGKDEAGQDVTLTEYYSGSALYALRPCTEAVARHHVDRHMDDPRPVKPLDFRDRPDATTHEQRRLQLARGERDEFDFDPDDNDNEGMDP